MITSGNHILHKRDIYRYLDDKNAILRPANYPGDCPGHGWAIENACGMRILTMNLMGVVFLESLASPFETADAILKSAQGGYDLSILDFHAEATSEKIALARYLDGRVDVIFGTHTHVQTNDACILPGKTGYITDIGMTGVKDSVLGVDSKCSITRFLTKMPVRFDQAEGKCRISGALFSYDTALKQVVSVLAINEE
ncbi:2',3'-cyclic-nucleotide 2'-phosphodiesterase [bioreactor metagenome]|uniref:2',3'-cyclic-nucleotide 2'-phosphodiesterase n=1 Tax=bioreactor metagenome TaxID=1076179 RepID=A0A645IAK4_9ZZZZ